MTNDEFRYSRFYVDVMRMFNFAGHTPETEPIFNNHTAKEFFFCDLNSSDSFSNYERGLVSSITNASFLFQLNDNAFDCSGFAVDFYSIEIDTLPSMRSDCAHDIHHLISRSKSQQPSIVVFKWEESFLISILKKGKCFLSDWFSLYYDMEEISEKIHICNMSLDSSIDYLDDFIYVIARWYYINPISLENAMWGLVPIKYPGLEDGEFNRELVREIVDENMHIAQNQYGYDYVAPDEKNVFNENPINIEKELDLLALELDSDELEIPEEFREDFSEYETNDYEDDEDLAKLAEYDDIINGLNDDTFNDIDAFVDLIEMIDDLKIGN